MKSERITTSLCQIDIAASDERFPLGKRGERPVRFMCSNSSDVQKIREMSIPGVVVRGSRIDCAFDSAIIVAENLGILDDFTPALRIRETCAVPLPGLERYRKLRLDKIRRDYQAEDIMFLTRRAYGLLAEPPRSGKTLVIIAVSVLVNAGKTLIICNSLGKPVWGEEIAKWTGESALLLYGRAGDEARFFCVPCLGTGEVATGELDTEGVPIRRQCLDCRAKNGQSLGCNIIQVQRLAPRIDSRIECIETGALKKDGTPKTKRVRIKFSSVPPVYECPVHKDITATTVQLCLKCQEELLSALKDAKYVIANYDILTAQRDKTDRGVVNVRNDLKGWAPILASLKLDMAVGSEIHKIRGVNMKREAEAQTRRKAFCDVTECIERVYTESGTPMVGFVRDYWSVLDATSNGLFS